MDPSGIPKNPKGTFDYLKVNKRITSIKSDSNQTSMGELLVFLKNINPPTPKKGHFWTYFFWLG